jgi:hypothetical protein
MRKTTLGLMIAVTPFVVAAQGSGSANARATARSDVNANVMAQGEVRVPASYSAQSRAQLERMYAEARARGMSDAAISRRVAEGQAKGASEAQVVAAASKYHAQMNATHAAMVRAGRERPQADEVERGANAMARGVTVVQLETMVRRAPSDRSLVVAFDVLTDLAARGVPVTQAVAEVQGKLEARASDAAILDLGTSVSGAVAGKIKKGGQ